MSRPKDIGTRAETAIARAAQVHGFPLADRLTLRGAQDRGDVGLCPGIIAEVKGGMTAKDASPALLSQWLADTEKERRNAGAEFAFLAVQRRGIGLKRAHEWHAHAYASDVWKLLGMDHRGTHRSDGWLIMPVWAMFRTLRRAGWGEPLAGDVE